MFEKLKQPTHNQPCDITGIEGYDMLNELGGVQWPLRKGDRLKKERRLFEDGCFYTADQKAKFVFEAPREVPEKTDSTYPLILLTGRGTSAQWHTQTRTGKSAILRKLHPVELWIEIHPEDAALRGIKDGDEVNVASRRSCITARALVTAAVGQGRVFLPMHDAKVNELTMSSVDPYSRQPSYKHCAVQVSVRAP